GIRLVSLIAVRPHLQKGLFGIVEAVPLLGESVNFNKINNLIVRETAACLAQMLYDVLRVDVGIGPLHVVMKMDISICTENGVVVQDDDFDGPRSGHRGNED